VVWEGSERKLTPYPMAAVPDRPQRVGDFGRSQARFLSLPTSVVPHCGSACLLRAGRLSFVTPAKSGGERM
jgi:hypothetical protein